jgi:hypothetical protein
MVQLPTSPRASPGKDSLTTQNSDSTLSPAWSVISGLDSDSTTTACLQSTLQYGGGLHHRPVRADSAASTRSDEDLYRAAQLQSPTH